MIWEEVTAMTNRHWQVFADLAAHDHAAYARVLEAVPGTALTHFADGSAEAAMIIDAPTQHEATLFVRLALLELGLEATALSVEETGPDDACEPFEPLDFADPAMARAQEWAHSLASPIPALT